MNQKKGDQNETEIIMDQEENQNFQKKTENELKRTKKDQKGPKKGL